MDFAADMEQSCCNMYGWMCFTPDENGHVTIPDDRSGLVNGAIPYEAFESCYDLQSVTILIVTSIVSLNSRALGATRKPSEGSMSRSSMSHCFTRLNSSLLIYSLVLISTLQASQRQLQLALICAGGPLELPGLGVAALLALEPHNKDEGLKWRCSSNPSESSAVIWLTYSTGSMGMEFSTFIISGETMGPSHTMSQSALTISSKETQLVAKSMTQQQRYVSQ